MVQEELQKMNVTNFISKIVLNGKKVFFTSDTHFFHANVIRYTNRPFDSVEQMNKTLIDNWNRVVGKNDVVFHLGDFAFGGKKQWNQILDQLNGKIYLVLGNHDMAFFKTALVERFELVALEMYAIIDEQHIRLSHEPFLCYGGSNRNVWQLFGHVHSRENKGGRYADRLAMLTAMQYDVGVDNNNYTPVSFEQVRDIISCRMTSQATL